MKFESISVNWRLTTYSWGQNLSEFCTKSGITRRIGLIFFDCTKMTECTRKMDIQPILLVMVNEIENYSQKYVRLGLETL